VVGLGGFEVACFVMECLPTSLASFADNLFLLVLGMMFVGVAVVAQAWIVRHV
jgi:hypothetical protein